jgi:hypothetical protein
MQPHAARGTPVLRRRGTAALIAALLGLGLLGCAPAGEMAEPPTPTIISTATTQQPAPSTTPTRLTNPAAPPASLTLPGLDHPAPVTLAPVSADGYLKVPDDVSALGWWLGSAPMGADSGTTLIAGHVDSAEQGLGVFARLADLKPGQEIEVLDGLGAPHRFLVTESVEIGKAKLPAELFNTAGPRRLALVTCAGKFDPVARSYADNLIIWANPV